MQKITFRHHRQVGDLIGFTSALASLHHAYPNEYQTNVKSPFRDLLLLSPYLTTCAGELIQVDYQEGIHLGLSMAEAYCLDLSNKLKRPLSLTHPPKLYLSEQEQKPFPGLPKEYIVFNAGRKPDITVKGLSLETVTEVVKKLPLPCVQVGLKEHSFPIRGAINLLGKTNRRQLMQVASGATAGFGGDTSLLHVCGALDTPYVCVTPPRLHLRWIELYKKTTLLSSFGKLDCCKDRPCGKRRVKPLLDKSIFDESLCLRPITKGSLPVAECVFRFTSEKIVSEIAKYL